MKINTTISFYFGVLLCLILSHVSFISKAQSIDFGKSYINLTKGINGGTVEPGDTLEIRASIVVRSGTFDSCGYFVNIPAGTTFIPGTNQIVFSSNRVNDTLRPNVQPTFEKLNDNYNLLLLVEFLVVCQGIATFSAVACRTCTTCTAF